MTIETYAVCHSCGEKAQARVIPVHTVSTQGPCSTGAIALWPAGWVVLTDGQGSLLQKAACSGPCAAHLVEVHWPGAIAAFLAAEAKAQKKAKKWAPP